MSDFQTCNCKCYVLTNAKSTPSPHEEGIIVQQTQLTIIYKELFYTNCFDKKRNKNGTIYQTNSQHVIAINAHLKLNTALGRRPK